MARSRSHPDPLITAVGDGLGAESVLSGSVGVKCSLIAEGRAEVYVHPVPFLKEWDTCAPEAVLRGAGGRVTDCAGRPLTYGKPDPAQRHGIFAARGDTWEAALPLVREVTATKLGFDS
jgi:3'(2'), 5'-bisphosphate nucleotidase